MEEMSMQRYRTSISCAHWTQTNWENAIRNTITFSLRLCSFLTPTCSAPEFYAITNTNWDFNSFRVKHKINTIRNLTNRTIESNWMWSNKLCPKFWPLFVRSKRRKHSSSSSKTTQEWFINHISSGKLLSSYSAGFEYRISLWAKTETVNLWRCAWKVPSQQFMENWTLSTLCATNRFIFSSFPFHCCKRSFFSFLAVCLWCRYHSTWLTTIHRAIYAQCASNSTVAHTHLVLSILMRA